MKVWKNIESKDDDEEAMINRLNYEYITNLDVEFWLNNKLKDNATNRIIKNYAKKLKIKGITTLHQIFKAEQEKKYSLEIKSIYKAWGLEMINKCKEKAKHPLPYAW